jgi:hypothetical protein
LDERHVGNGRRGGERRRGKGGGGGGGEGRREVKSDKCEEDRNVDGCTVVDVGPDFAVGSK